MVHVRRIRLVVTVLEVSVATVIRDMKVSNARTLMSVYRSLRTVMKRLHVQIQLVAIHVLAQKATMGTVKSVIEASVTISFVRSTKCVLLPHR